MNTKNIIIGTLSFIVSSFLVQAISHFGLNTAHYASIEFMREPPIMYLGLLTMLIQGIVLSIIYQRWTQGQFNVKQGLKFGWLVGVFFVSYLAFVEPSKYDVENILSWIMVEGLAGAVQFTIFGALIGRFIKSE